MPVVSVVRSSPSILTIACGERQHDFHAIWIRDACSCSECRRPRTNERLLDPTSIDLGITIESVTGDEVLQVQMSDGHTVALGAEWLCAHLDAFDHRAEPAVGRRLWTGAAPPPIVTMRLAELDDPAALVKWLDGIATNGCAVITDVPPTSAGLCAVAARIGEIRATNYGVTWEIDATLEPVSAVDSERHLLVHTDLPYREVAPGVQFLLAAVTDVAGGASTLVDGYAVAEQLRRADPEAWRVLTSVEFSYPFVRDDVELIGRAPIIGLHPDGRYHQIRRAPDLVGVPFVEADAAPVLYAALGRWNELVDDPANEIRIELRAGELLAFDNHRLLHGRTAFELGAEGRRLLLGCYLDVEDVHSRRAIAARSC